MSMALHTSMLLLGMMHAALTEHPRWKLHRGCGLRRLFLLNPDAISDSNKPTETPALTSLITPTCSGRIEESLVQYDEDGEGQAGTSSEPKESEWSNGSIVIWRFVDTGASTTCSRWGPLSEWLAIGCTRSEAAAWLAYEFDAARLGCTAGRGKDSIRPEVFEELLHQEFLLAGSRATRKRLWALWRGQRLLLRGLRLHELLEGPSSRIPSGRFPTPEKGSEEFERTFRRQLRLYVSRVQQLSPSRRQRDALIAFLRSQPDVDVSLLLANRTVDPNELVAAFRQLLRWFSSAFPYNKAECNCGAKVSLVA